MNRVNSDIHYFLEQHEQEIINCCKKAMSNKEIIELLKTAVAEILNETEPKDLSKNPEKSLDIVSKASIHCQTKGVNDGQKY